MAARQRFTRSAEELAACLSEHASSPGWFRYSEDPKSTINKKGLIANANIMTALHNCSPNMSFNQSTMEQAVRKITEGKRDEWNLDPEACRQQPIVIARRLRVACRHVAQSIRKRPKWLRSVIDLHDDEDAKQDNNEESSAPGDAASSSLDAPIAKHKRRSKHTSESNAAMHSKWEVWGWDAEMQRAFRATGSKPGDTTEYSNDIRIPDGAKKTDPVCAFFGETSYPISELTVADFTLRQNTKATAARKKSVKGPPSVVGIHPPSFGPSAQHPKTARPHHVDFLVSWLRDGTKTDLPSAAVGLPESGHGSLVHEGPLGIPLQSWCDGRHPWLPILGRRAQIGKTTSPRDH